MAMPLEATVENAGPSRQLLFYTLVLVAFLAASGVPTPLYPLYQSSWHFSTPMLTLAFALYMFTLLLALLTTGKLSEYMGRRPVILIGLVIEIASMLCFLVAHDLTILLVARALQGLATGIATSALGAAIIDTDHRRGPVLASVAPLVGMGLGALCSGVLVDLAPYPMRLGFILMTAIFIWQLIGLRGTRESVSPRSGALASLRPTARIPAPVRPTFLRVIPACIASWSLGGFSLSLGPVLARQVSGIETSMIGGAMVSLLSMMGAVGVWNLRRQKTRRILLLSSILLPLGVSIVLLGVATHSILTLLIGFAIAGPGFGGGFMGAMRAIMPLAPDGGRASLMAVLYVVSYLSASLPAMVAGNATQHFGLEPTVYGYGAYVIALSLMALVGMLSQRQATA
ncbi:MFS transporter [Halomonas elongata]|uniref:MFS transporter n=1 Tax=Halomonas elongata (strain ATCC 33173 / DSM 2581 / NBRC 15536 / NCIMB 2198 / 1H9) TaxID=768066 RepID=E1V6M0_HALED|nr:MFS transporter [Halomonas elongata]WBF18584.1 MFS transporter [Halomonas elongata]WPU47438.1 MFS transporter [Halomonas elongata DSM 2581]WVI72107.1 MFS transporter [Halomonas elongata]CBV41349.1 major facilitator superfamily transport protein [Halomonas elongata DSM 2581]